MRSKNFEKLKFHPYYGNLFSKLKKSEIEICQTIVFSSENIGADDFEKMVNRLFLDEKKPKNLGIMIDLLLACR